MSERDCNGWANHETEVVSQWIGADETSLYWLEAAKGCWFYFDGDDICTKDERVTAALARLMKAEFDKARLPVGDADSLDRALLDNAYSCINWNQIARSYVVPALEGFAMELLAMASR